MAAQRRRRGPMHEINVVPYIDVMLVLLVIFMVTAPFVPTATIELPTVGAAKSRPEAFVEVVVEQNGAMTVRTHNLPQRMERRASSEQLIDTINDVRRYTNHQLKIRGILPTMYDPRVTHSQQVLEEIGSRYAIPIFDPPIRKSIRFAEAPSRGRSILSVSPKHPGSSAYRQIARTLV